MMDWKLRKQWSILGVLLAGSGVLLVGCGPIVLTIETDSGEESELGSQEDSLVDPADDDSEMDSPDDGLADLADDEDSEIDSQEGGLADPDGDEDSEIDSQEDGLADSPDDEDSEVDPPAGGGQGISDLIASTSLFEVVNPQLLEIMPDVEVTEEVDDDSGEMTLMLDNGNSVASVTCKCPLGGSGFCVGLFPHDGSPASCSGECDAAGTICTWISNKPKSNLAIDGSFADLALDGALFE